MVMSFCAVFFPRGVLDEILNLIESRKENPQKLTQLSSRSQFLRSFLPTLIWDQHISEFPSKTNGTVEILRRDLSFAAYEILGKPKLEYIIYRYPNPNSDLAG